MTSSIFMSSDSDAPSPKQDMVFVHSVSEQGDALRVIRKREEKIELGEMRAVEEGRPIQGDLVRLKPRAEHERLYDVEVLLSQEEVREQAEAAGRSGPAQVATDAYRRNWEAIFGPHEEPKMLN